MSLAQIISEISYEMQGEKDRGKTASYIPSLAQVDLHHWGMAIVDRDGKMYASGDSHKQFSIQSVSKVFGLSLALDLEGDDLWERVRQEPSGSPFNSIIQLESEHGIPRNPFINAGAIVVSDILVSKYGFQGAQGALLQLLNPLVSNIDGMFIDYELAQEEDETGFRNRALTNYMKNFDNIHNSVDETLGFYFRQCALSMNCQQLAEAGAFLMSAGINPRNGKRVLSTRHTQTTLALMMMCGHYDGSGAFAVRVGLPGKSGVGGGILAIVPGVASIAVWSPGLNEKGNSLLGTKSLERLVQKTGWSVFRY
ncbi:glutaminase [Swingsia samuiensis]|uniref:glutaminase n=1 Tax=Swingsia samuiensis TaxID=1293412 RepID=UPI001FE53820|nr:glutaminase [Swingsia samuiensis]